MNKNARWIWPPGDLHPRNAQVRFKKTVTLPADPQKARINLTADSRYHLTVNGIYQGSGPARYWKESPSYDARDLKRILQKGENIIEVLVEHYGVSTSQYQEAPAGLMAEIEITLPDGERMSVLSDDTWLTSPHGRYARNSPRINVALPWMEIYDASRPDDPLWTPARNLNRHEKSTRPVPRDIPFLEEVPLPPPNPLQVRRTRNEGFALCIDVRDNFFPGSYDSTDKKLLGLLAMEITCREETTGRIRLLSRKWPETEEIFRINGKEHLFTLDRDWIDLTLPAGKHLVIHDLSGYHQRFTMSYHFDFDREISFGGFRTAGPFESGNVLNIVAIQDPLDFTRPLYRKACRIASEEDMEAMAEHVRPVTPQQVNRENPHLLSLMALETQAPVQVKADYLSAFGHDGAEDAGDDLEILLDFGRETSAFLEWELTSPGGVIIDMEPAEYRDKETGAIQYPTDINAALRYITKEGHQRYRSLQRRGFRYIIMTVRGLKGRIRDFKITAWESTYPAGSEGRFTSSDPLYESIYDISQRTVKLCSEDAYVDCPAYEQAYWIGDGRNEALIDFYTRGAYPLARRCLKLTAGSLDYSPLPEAQVPTGCRTALTAWSLLWILSCHEYHRHSGDLDGVAEVFDGLTFSLDELLRHINPRGLLEIEAWNMLDWAPMDTPVKGAVTHLNALLIRSLQETADLAERLNRESLAGRWESKADELERALFRELWRPDQQAFADAMAPDGVLSSVVSMQTQIMVYLCTNPPDEIARRLESYLAAPPKEFVQVGSPFMDFFNFEAMEKMGRPDLILKRIREKWGAMIERGATACWETYAGFDRGRVTRSHCHGWSAAPGYFLPRIILGVRPMEPGFSRVEISPYDAGLDRAEGSVPTPLGPLKVAWEKADGKLEINVDAPEGCSYEIIAPKKEDYHE